MIGGYVGEVCGDVKALGGRDEFGGDVGEVWGDVQIQGDRHKLVGDVGEDVVPRELSVDVEEELDEAVVEGGKHELSDESAEDQSEVKVLRDRHLLSHMTRTVTPKRKRRSLSKHRSEGENRPWSKRLKLNWSKDQDCEVVQGYKTYENTTIYDKLDIDNTESFKSEVTVEDLVTRTNLLSLDASPNFKFQFDACSPQHVRGKVNATGLDLIESVPKFKKFQSENGKSSTGKEGLWWGVIGNKVKSWKD